MRIFSHIGLHNEIFIKCLFNYVNFEFPNIGITTTVLLIIYTFRSYETSVVYRLLRYGSFTISIKSSL